MEHQCTSCHRPFAIENDEREFLEKMEFRFGEKIVHPELPSLCPDCRLQRRTIHRNERNLYRVRSDFSGKEIISIYAGTTPAGQPLPIYGQEEWTSDAWDALEYGREFDFNRPFFEQFQELMRVVPRRSLITDRNENSDFSTGTAFCKNCYLINSSEYCEDCYYGKLYQNSKSSVDCSYLYDSERCYQCFSVYNSYNCQYLWFSKNCNDCLFSSNLQGCKNCFLCTNLVQKEYQFMNEPLAPEEYKKRVAEIQGSYTRFQQLKEKLSELRMQSIHKYANIVNSENCSGDYIENSKNCRDSYDMTDSEDCRYVTVGVNIKDCYDCSNMYLKPELCFDTLGTIEAHTVAYCLYIFYSQRMLYCDTAYHSHDCFGCISMNRNQYCILNKQYTKEEYEVLVPKIIEHMKKDGYKSASGPAMNHSLRSGSWGQFFPKELSPFGYNESVASEYFPLTETEARAQGFMWREKDARSYRPQTIAFPETIDEVTDSITQEILCCKNCTKNYRVIPQELAFYKEMKIPIPRECPDCRYAELMQLRNPRQLWERTCDKCKASMQTTFSPDHPETVYCEKCYRENIF